MLQVIPIIILLIVPCFQQSILTAYPPLSPQIILHGRYYITNGDVAFDWTCFQIDFCFQNSTKVIINIVDSWNIYHVVVDGGEPKILHPKKT